MKNSSGSLISNGVWSLLSQAVRVGSLALIMIAFEPSFRPPTFRLTRCRLGDWLIFAAVAIFGLDRVVVRHLVDQNGLGGSIIYEGFWLKLSIAAVSYIAMVGLIFTFRRGDTLLLLVAMVAGVGLLFPSRGCL